MVAVQVLPSHPFRGLIITGIPDFGGVTMLDILLISGLGATHSPEAGVTSYLSASITVNEKISVMAKNLPGQRFAPPPKVRNAPGWILKLDFVMINRRVSKSFTDVPHDDSSKCMTLLGIIKKAPFLSRYLSSRSISSITIRVPAPKAWWRVASCMADIKTGISLILLKSRMRTVVPCCSSTVSRFAASSRMLCNNRGLEKT